MKVMHGRMRGGEGAGGVLGPQWPGVGGSRIKLT